VLTRDPGNDLARRGIDSVADELIVQAERALMEQDVTRLASAVDAVRAVRPDHARLPFFISQLEQERAIQGTAGQPVRAVDSMGRPIEAPAATGELPSVRVQAFVQLANERMRSNQLVGKDGALGYVLSARRIDPSDPGVVAAAGALGNEFAGNVQKAIRENQLDDANRWYQNAVELGVERPRLAALRADIDAARIGNERADRARLLVLANQRIAQGRLLEPKGDSAQHYVDLLGASAPDLDGLADTRALLASRTLAEARTAVGANNLDRADALVRAAAAAGAPAADVADVNARIMSQRVARATPAPSEPAVLPESALRRTAFMAPAYPARARERGTEGWVDLEFTVATDGTTQDAVVRAAEPAGTFDRAALDAVKRWRYEPRVVGGNVVEQRVEARLRFRLAD
jgi:protein TonB